MFFFSLQFHISWLPSKKWSIHFFFCVLTSFQVSCLTMHSFVYCCHWGKVCIHETFRFFPLFHVKTGHGTKKELLTVPKLVVTAWVVIPFYHVFSTINRIRFSCLKLKLLYAFLKKLLMKYKDNPPNLITLTLWQTLHS